VNKLRQDTTVETKPAIQIEPDLVPEIEPTLEVEPKSKVEQIWLWKLWQNWNQKCFGGLQQVKEW
jgi:hypothetical protein